jgi:phosphoglycolate phosphatase
MKKELIIFDMDGTLIDSGNVIANTINFVRSNLGLQEIEKYEMLSKLNDPNINSSEYFYGTKGFTDEQTKLFHEYYDAHCISDIILYDGIKELLKTLKEKNCTLGVATNASKEFAVKMLEHLNIKDHFSSIIGAYCVQNPKPHPDMILKTLEFCKIEKHQAILIGDSEKDKLAAKAANIDGILVNWGFTNHKEDDVITDVTQLHHHLSKLI